MATKEIVWFEDLYSFVFNQDNWLKFIPDKNYTFIENLNAVMRFSLLFSLVIFFVKRDYTALYFALFVGFMTYALYMHDKRHSNLKIELFDKMNLVQSPTQEKSICYKPSADNPFMNVSYIDQNDFPNRPPACDGTRKSTKLEVKKLFDSGLYRDVDDIFHKKASDRQFYTTPSTTIPNDQRSFAEWCFKTAKTLKESHLE
jgi:hypothetical protein